MRLLKITPSITNTAEDSLRRYLGDIGKVKLLTPEEEIKLARMIRKGDRAAEHRLVTANLRFVVSCAKKYQKFGLSLPDLVSEGNLGLIKAARMFDETKGFKFISYAVWWIRQAMLLALNEQGRLVRLPMNQQLAMTAINTEAIRLERELERAPTMGELAEAVGKSTRQVSDCMLSNTRAAYLDDIIPGGETESNTLLNYLPDESSDSITHWSDNQFLHRGIVTMMAKLKARDQEIIKLSFGLLESPKLDVKDIAERLNLSTERIRKLRVEALEKLRMLVQHTSLKEHA
ncbi:MAG: sigma-70 family RNA polymerase sigma factor [Pedobacter sp.]|nr:MAG: sigma-70 family RNA polymerase sigma factor [Pedobacter sp.]